jgi:hypothetical protein
LMFATDMLYACRQPRIPLATKSESTATKCW